MISAADFLALPFTPDLSAGGLTYALRVLPYLQPHAGTSPANRLRQRAAGASVELAFRRHLTQMGIPFAVREAAPFSDPERYDVSLGGRRCNIKSFLISRRDQITRLRSDPGALLQAPALVPSDRHAAEGHNPHDLYLFAFIQALTAPSLRETHRALKSGQPAHLVFCMSPAWARPRGWNPLGPLALKSECSKPISLLLFGQDAAHDPLTCRVDLLPRTRVVAGEGFHSLSALQADTPPDGRVGVHSPVAGETCLVQPHQWENIHLYGMGILLVGYITRAEFSEKAAPLPPGERVFQFRRTQSKNLAVPVGALHPLSELFAGARDWYALHASR